MSLYKKVGELWLNSGEYDTEEGNKIFNILLENRRASQKEYTKSYYYIIALLIIQFLFAENVTQKISFLSVDIENKNIVLWFIPLVMTFFYYKATISLITERTLNKSIITYIKMNHEFIHKKDLHTIVNLPSLLDIENLLAENNNGFARKTIDVFMYIIMFSILLFPVIIIIYYTINNLKNWNDFDLHLLKIIFLILIVILMIRSFFLIHEMTRT